ncbi:hypothetical protein D9757_006379 [Collybiopsis confluens]|uniref:Uncharacterized protein n=1 Tax=Collybiopsis confluens TaxID=2823264 RepID=A0A8H5HGN0_9AGAR|nr:hypothetical protein D9757_006379 [Collybiopsis confluens]
MPTSAADTQSDVLVIADSVQQESEPSESPGKSQLDATSKESPPTDDNQACSSSPSLRIYSRPHLLALSKSPLICIPPNMPELKEWFGAENEQNLSKKESEPSTPNSGRERRFRRDADDNELPARPSFRSSLSQPSQMGNFKHQSLRNNDRDTDREGQERLRNLSEKFDRDRLGLPTSGLRTGKERSIAPHLAAGSARISSQAQGTIATRRAETRESSNKKKVGESSEDWRRGAESRRTDRNDRGDREDRARSRSRTRRDPSISRREGKDREKEREEYRRERAERERDDDDDSRRWRDDGRRDERITTRRERERAGNGKDKDSTSSNPNDRRWTVVEDRDKSKRSTGRDKKSFAEEGRSDDRRGDREREKEKEPAWMDTYIPLSSSSGILGGQGSEGELDGIQAWKKNMKEKEQKVNKVASATPIAEATTPLKPVDAEEPLDEIQRFKKLMEMAQKQSPDSALIPGPILGPSDSSKSTTSNSRENDAATAISRPPEPSSSEFNPTVSSKQDLFPTPNPPRSLLSLLNSASSDTGAQSSSNTDTTKLSSRLPLADSSVERVNNDANFNPPQGSRLLALGNRAPAKPLSPNPLLAPSAPNGSAATVGAPKSQPPGLPNPSSITDSSKIIPRTPSNFSPFEEHQRELGDALRRTPGDRSSFTSDSGSLWPDSSPFDSTTAGHAIGRGSRFAKFFEGKAKDTPVSAPSIPKAPTPVGFTSPSPGPHYRPESGFSNIANQNIEQHRTVDDLFAKLNMNSLPPRPVSGSNVPLNHTAFSQQAQNQLHALSHQQQQQQLQNQLLNNARLEPLYESRNFMPDNMVPGLRAAPPPRARENGGMFTADSLDDAILLNAQQRLPVQQQRVVEQMYGGSIPAAAAFAQQQQIARNPGIPVQTPHYRGGPSPVSAHQNLLHNAQQQQRMPPGLANLGGRPPHDPSQFGLPGPVHNGLHINGISQQQQNFNNNFHPAAGFGGPQGPLRPPAHQLQNSVSHHQLAGLGHPSNLDARNANQHAQLLAMSGLGGVGLRNVSGGGFSHQSPNGLQNPMLALRQQQQQQQQQIHHQMLPHHLLPPHLQQGPVHTNQNASAQDLMALLMGTQRD